MMDDYDGVHLDDVPDESVVDVIQWMRACKCGEPPDSKREGFIYALRHTDPSKVAIAVDHLGELRQWSVTERSRTKAAMHAALHAYGGSAADIVPVFAGHQRKGPTDDPG